MVQSFAKLSKAWICQGFSESFERTTKLLIKTKAVYQNQSQNRFFITKKSSLLKKTLEMQISYIIRKILLKHQRKTNVKPRGKTLILQIDYLNV